MEMKKDFFKVLLLGVFTAFLTACGDDEPQLIDNSSEVIWDFAPFNVQINVQDESGLNLLSRNAENGFYGADFSIKYNDEVYNAQWIDDGIVSGKTVSSRVLPASFYGLYAMEISRWKDGVGPWVVAEDEYRLFFGEFDTTDNHDLSLQLSFPEVNQDIFAPEEVYQIGVKHSFRWLDKDSYSIEHDVTLNGNPVQLDDDGCIIIVVPRK